MNVKKRIYTLCVTCGIVLGSVVGIPVDSTQSTSLPDTKQKQALRFADIDSNSWYYPYIEYLVGSGVVKGISDTEFAPDGTFTVAEAAAVITRYLGLEAKAEERKKALQTLGVDGAESWFSGYVQLMHEADIIDVQKYGCSISDNIVRIYSPEILNQPVKRYEFAAFVSRSFELGDTEIRTASGSSGEEFIYGGAYDESILSKYQKYINDYNDIPDGFKEYVLKLYYNGIFNGDDLGNFNPLSNLTRAEMAKVISVITDMSLRTRIEISDGVVLSDDSYITVKGKKFLKTEVSDAFLSQEAGGVSTYYDNGMPFVSYKRVAAMPEGYILEVKHYTVLQSGFSLLVNDGTTTQDNYINTFSSGDKILLVLKKLTTGEGIDAVYYTLNDVGNIVGESLRYLPE